MSVCGPGGQTEEDSGSEEVTTSGAAVREIYKQKPTSKVVRVLTVVAYLLSVSLAAILLSVYYVCVWKSPELPPLNDTGGGGEGEASAISASAHRAEDTHYVHQQHTYTGRSDSTVESLGESSNITTTGGAEMGTDAESGHVASMAAVHVDSSGNTTSLYETRHVDSGGNTTGLYDTSTVDYSETPTLNNETDTGT